MGETDQAPAAARAPGAVPASGGDQGVLVRGGWVVTSGPAGAIPGGAVHVLGETIAAVGPYAELAARLPGVPVLGGPYDLVTPGFVNTHGHFSEGLITGLGERYTLWEWLGEVIEPVEGHLDEEMAHAGTTIAGIQMLRTGITLANDMFVCQPRERPATPGVVRALDELRLRGVVSYGAFDHRTATPVEAIMREHTALAEAAAASRFSRFRVGVGAVGEQSDALFAKSVELAVGGGHGVHIHLQEIREEVTASRLRFGTTPVGHCARASLFEAPTLAAHCVWVDDEDSETLASHGVGVAHNPVSNMILASGVCPVAGLRRRGVNVGLGVDGPASNDRQDMLEVIKSAVLLARVDRLRATAMLAKDALEMATIGGARALRLDARLGSLEPGKAADLVVFDGTSPALANVHDPYQAIVYVAGPREVKDVWVAGERSVAGGEVVTVDVAEAVARSRPLARRLAQAAGLSRHSALAREAR